MEDENYDKFRTGFSQMCRWFWHCNTSIMMLRAADVEFASWPEEAATRGLCSWETYGRAFIIRQELVLLEPNNFRIGF